MDRESPDAKAVQEAYRRRVTGSEQAPLNRYLVETYWPGVTESQLAATTRRASNAAVMLTTQGTEIRCVHAMLVSKDEVSFCLFEADSEHTVAEACNDAGLRFDRILHVIQIETPLM